MKDLAEDQQLRLPELAALTELEIRKMWLPLNPPSENPRVLASGSLYFLVLQANQFQGYVYRLDGRDLLVISYGMGDPKKYRISANGVLQIEEAVIFNT